MINVAEVRIWGTKVGAVITDENSQFVYFQYDNDFIDRDIELSPIYMQLSNEVYQFKTLPLESFKGLPGLLSDSLPDRYGEKIINIWLEKQGRAKESFSIVERLCYIGSRGMGALEFYPAKHKELNEIEDIDVSNLVELSNQILNEKESVIAKSDNDLEDIIKVGTSAGGARAKAIIAFNEDTNTIKSGQINAGEGYTYWILKLDGVNQQEETSFTRREYAYYLMALDAKINMSESRLLEKDGYYHFMTKRFDRVINSRGKFEKLHMQTLAALAHIDYNDPGAISYEYVATNIMYKLGLKLSENKQFFRRMVFNVMSRNQDDHVKNISFLMNKQGEWSLSPAYDITYSYNPSGKWTARHQMTVNTKRDNILLEDLLESAEVMKIKEKDAKEIIQDVRNAISKWESFAKKSFLENKEINQIRNQFRIL